MNSAPFVLKILEVLLFFILNIPTFWGYMCRVQSTGLHKYNLAMAGGYWQPSGKFPDVIDKPLEYVSPKTFYKWCLALVR
jgi:ABC-type dipeptide/oligopeptide/nickel transport system permease component